MDTLRLRVHETLVERQSLLLKNLQSRGMERKTNHFNTTNNENDQTRH